MDWRLAKTLFIFVFVLVNIFLVLVYINRVTRSQVNKIESDNEVNSRQEEARISTDVLSKDISGTRMQVITATSRNFKSYAENKSSLETSGSGFTLGDRVDNTINIGDRSLSNLKDYIINHIYNGKVYQLGGMNSNIVIYEQTYDGYPLLNSNKARLRFNTGDGKATTYKQTLMNRIEPAKGDNNPKKQVITPRKAIEGLYFNRYLEADDEILDVRLGYCSVIRETNVQLLQANWEIKMKHKGKEETKKYYVETTSVSPKVIDS